MIQLSDLSKSYGDQVLFEEAGFTLAQGERAGLVGRNGHGKTTLFKIILGQEEADGGEVSIPKGYRIGHLEQHVRFSEPTLLEEGCLGLRPEERDHSYKVERILFGLGFGPEDLERPPESFSGGYNIRLNLAKVLVSDPDLLLLDEPTNYLDIVSIRWLARFLRQWPRELLLITHDREFMDGVTTHTIGIHRHRVRKIEGSTEKLYEQLILEEEVHEKTRVNVEKKRKEMLTFINRFRAKARKASVVQSRIKLMEKLPEVGELGEIRDLDFQFKVAPFPAKFVGDIHDLEFSYPDDDGRLPDIPLIRDLSLDLGKRDRIGVIGKNGRGKSTLLKLVGGELIPLGGVIKFHDATRLGYFGQTNVDRLSPHLTVEDEVASANPHLGQTQVRTLCGTMMFDGDLALKKIEVLSGGERSRVLLAKILASETNLLLLDEPTSHLDMASVEAMADSLEEYPGAVILVTHNEMMLRRVCNRLVVFQSDGVRIVEGGYESFLEKVGWEDEASLDRTTGVPSTPSGESGLSRKERRKRRSEVVQERSRSLGPMKARMDEIEEEIMDLEGGLEKLQAQLVEAAEKSEGDRIQDLSRSTHQHQESIEQLFGELEDLTTTHDAETRRYDALLAELEGD